MHIPKTSSYLNPYFIKARGYADIWNLPFDDHLTLHFGINNPPVNGLPNESSNQKMKLFKTAVDIWHRGVTTTH